MIRWRRQIPAGGVTDTGEIVSPILAAPKIVTV
jgi:hypothetical protein